jgi:hypothetical protein
MKTIINTDTDMNFSLHNVGNYKNELISSLDDITDKYSNLLIEYLKFILENIKKKNTNCHKFIIIRGLHTITNVFLTVLLYTKNIDITHFHCQKSIYFYVEFIGQISEDEKMFLQLTSRDASIYVYKKTIFEINNEFKKLNEKSSMEFKNNMNIINSYINLYKMYIHKIIDNNNEKNEKNEYYIDIFKNISEKLNNNLVDKNKIKVLEYIVGKLYNKIDDIDLFYNVNNELVKKFNKNPNILNNVGKKILEENFIDKLNNPFDKFIHWFLQS